MAWRSRFQWIWNLRLELGHQLVSSPMRVTEFAPAVDQSKPQGYAPPMVGGAWKTGRFAGEAFALQPDGTVRCPADKRLVPCERRKEAGSSLRIVFAARIADCRACQLREQCQWNGKETRKPRQMSVLLHPLKVGPEPLLWYDWPRRSHRRACRELLRRERVEVTVPQAPPALPAGPLPRSQRAHYRLSWEVRLARNARVPTDVPPTITVFGIPDQFAAFLGLKAA